MNQLPAWDIESEYPTLNSSEFKKDEARVQEIIQSIKGLTEKIRPALDKVKTEKLSDSETKLLVDGLQEIFVLDQESTILRWNLSTYVNCILSNDAKDTAGKAKDSQLTDLHSAYGQTIKPTSLFLSQCENEIYEKVIAHPKLTGSKFSWDQQRLLKHTLLSEKEETLLTAMGPTGFQAWSELYDTIAGSMKVKIELDGKIEEVGLAQATSMTKGPDSKARKAAWQGIQHAWRNQEESSAAILNSLAGWRLELNKKRSHTKPVDFMDMPLFQSRIQKETLDAMLTAVQNNAPDIQKAALLMAKMHGKAKLDPWDLLAPAPIATQSKNLSFAEGIKQIRDAFNKVSPEFGNFIDMMNEKKWIEGRVLPNKRNGAYCTGFAKSNTPRVFMTYMGSNQDVSTLAHELGHAFHSWSLRDLPLDQQDYPMTLAETASIFAETVLADELIQNAKTKEEKMDFAWANVEGAVSLLLNIPARYEFESKFYEARKEKTQTPDELRTLTNNAWKKWYGDTLTENDQMFWATKLHFSIAGVSFYNFPYTFGYLFALSIYARRKELGDKFMGKYVEILRDTGRMTAEDLIQKHLGEDIRKPQFWQKSIDVVKSKIKDFEALI